MDRNRINAFLLTFLRETGRKETLNVLKNELQEDKKEENTISARVKLSFTIQRPPKRKPLLEVPVIKERAKKAKIASDDPQVTEKIEKIPKEFKKLAKAVGLPKSHLDFFYKHRDSFHWEMKKDNNIYCTGKRGNCKFKTKVKKNCLFDHMISVHNHGEFKCKQENCEYVGYSQTNLKMHVAQFHGIGKFGSNRNRGFPCSF
ncbi:Oidioi.mRNA.OKI2018_I69.chr1.g1518.t1.cds [Oikopleura dioica]|uniref:Oidioi.mRNA.OKI2018_I69.chr1.g1518.t1.cds n=1 Tax=Oikopleura dioica TaxID=34765 RepID=A0ABN7SPV8_OIKDI|nr:Oidioi.mRNA.OKI2018_I69.chr1.g1518.t1.cds [Oikopleura dioica]